MPASFFSGTLGNIARTATINCTADNINNTGYINDGEWGILLPALIEADRIFIQLKRSYRVKAVSVLTSSVTTGKVPIITFISCYLKLNLNEQTY